MTVVMLYFGFLVLNLEAQHDLSTQDQLDGDLYQRGPQIEVANQKDKYCVVQKLIWKYTETIGQLTSMSFAKNFGKEPSTFGRVNLRWSRPPDPVSPRHDANMPQGGPDVVWPVVVPQPAVFRSSNFQSPVRRMHSGKITRNSENWCRS